MDSKDATNLLSTKTLVKFGLNRQPFMDKGSHRYAFEDSAISTQLNVLINIIHGSDKIVMIKGENGIGKSSLLYKLAKTRHKGLTFCPIKATDKITIEGICKLALKQLEIQAPSSNASIPEFFAKRVAFRRRTEGKTVLLIDDADQLDSYTIDQLLLLRKLVAEDGVPAISIVFAGHPQLEQILTALPRINNHLSILHTIYLYPFSEKQTTDYINQRLQFASNDENIELLTPAQIQSIHNKAKGIPSLINYETCRVLETLAGNKSTSDIQNFEQNESSASNKFVPAALITVGLLSLAFIGYLFYGHTQFASTEDENISSIANTTLPTKKVTPYDSQQPPVAVEATDTATTKKTQTETELQEPAIVAVEPIAEPVVPLEQAVDSMAKKATDQPVSEQKVAQATPTPRVTEPKEPKPTDKETADKIEKPIPVIPVITATKVDTTSDQQKAPPKKPEQVTIKTDTIKPEVATAAAKPAETGKPVEQELAAKPEQKLAEKTIVEPPKKVLTETNAKTKPEAEPVTPEANPSVKAKTQVAKTKPATAIPQTQIKPRPKAAPTAKKATENTVNVWIKAQPPLNYTMQLLAAKDPSSLNKYKDKYPSLKDAKIALTLRKGKEWYVLIIGSFKTTKDANAFLKNQPKPISNSKPWIRRFKPLQNTLK